MKNVIHILLLEDSPTDEDLIRHTLRRDTLTYSVESVDTRTAFSRWLEESQPDLILSDFSLPSLDGYTALALAREKYPDVPFIFVTGTLGEEVAIETLKKGATDYVLKHRLSRLLPSIHRALREAKERAERRRAEGQLRESHEQLRALTVYLQHVREEERTRIAREVHDELGQALTGLKLHLAWLKPRLPIKLKALHRKVEAMSAHIDETIQAVRRIATELRPGLLDTAGLLAALEWQASIFENQTGIKCRVKADVKETLWDQDLNTVFFRIFQETLTNIIRHAGARRVDVCLAQRNGDLVLEITDDGRGITEAEIHNTKSIGLLGMRERAALLGGELRVNGNPGHGTTVLACIPRSPRQRKINYNENPSYRRPRGGAARLKANSR